MAGRVLLRAAALGVATTAAWSLHAVSQWTPPERERLQPFVPFVRVKLLESAQGLQAALLRAHPLSGAHLRDVRARAELDLARVDVLGDGGDPAAATDLRLFLALLAARDGRTDEALRLYEEAARDSPFDPRPRALGYQLSLFAGRKDEVVQWCADYHRLVPEIDASVPPGFECRETWVLIRELAVAATLGGVLELPGPGSRFFIISAACGTVDEGLVAALQDKALPAVERLQLQALRIYLRAKVRLLLRKEEREFEELRRGNSGNGGAEASPVS